VSGRRGARVALAGGIVVLLAGGGLTANGFTSRTSAQDEQRARRAELDAASEELQMAEERRALARNRLSEARIAAAEALHSGRPTVLIVELLVENDAELLSLARRMRSAALGGSVSEFNQLADESNAIASESNVLRRRLGRTLFPGP